MRAITVVAYGRLVDNCVVHEVGGKRVLDGSIACAKPLSKQTEGGQNADFLKVAFWSSTACDNAEKYQKGRAVTIFGKLECDEYKDSRGIWQKEWKIIADDINFHTKLKEGENPAQGSKPAPQSTTPASQRSSNPAPQAKPATQKPTPVPVTQNKTATPKTSPVPVRQATTPAPQNVKPVVRNDTTPTPAPQEVKPVPVTPKQDTAEPQSAKPAPKPQEVTNPAPQNTPVPQTSDITGLDDDLDELDDFEG